MPEVQETFKKGKIVISNGSTCAFVAEELLGVELEKWKFPCGVITRGRTCTTPDNRLHPLRIKDGIVLAADMSISMWEEIPDFFADFSANDIFIKGANAVDHERNVGFLLSHPNGGTIGMALGRMAAQGSRLIVPVGLEKLVLSVVDASRTVPGINKVQYSFGLGAGYFAVTNATVVTEIEAFAILAGVKATHLASGGVGDSEGAVTLYLEGDKTGIDKAVELIKSIKGEKPVKSWKKPCTECSFQCELYPGK